MRGLLCTVTNTFYFTNEAFYLIDYILFYVIYSISTKSDIANNSLLPCLHVNVSG